jgi:hypothetical protein
VARRNPNTQSVIVGHSFGGLIVEKALSQVMVSIATGSALREPGATPGSFRLLRSQFPADLIVLVNPAAPALFARSELSALEQWKVEACEAVKPEYVCGGSPAWRPLIVSITSEGDDATGFWFPVGTSLGYSLERYRDYKYDACPRVDRPAVDTPTHQQRYYYTHTEGHVSELFSHTLSQKNAPQGEAGKVTPCAADPCKQDQSELCFVSGSSSFVIKQSQVWNGEKSLNQGTPYWIMQAPVSVIKNHGDIFNDVFIDLLAGLLDVTSRRDRPDAQTADCRKDSPPP